MDALAVQIGIALKCFFKLHTSTRIQTIKTLSSYANWFVLQSELADDVGGRRCTQLVTYRATKPTTQAKVLCPLLNAWLNNCLCVLLIQLILALAV